MIIAINFDGTCVKNAYPNIGESIGAEEVLKELLEHGHKLMLVTTRDDCPQDRRYALSAAKQWFVVNGIDLWSINHNPNQVAHTTSVVPFAQISISQYNLGCPVIDNKSDKPYVNWVVVRHLLAEKGVLPFVKKRYVITFLGMYYRELENGSYFFDKVGLGEFKIFDSCRDAMDVVQKISNTLGNPEVKTASINIEEYIEPVKNKK